MSIFSYSGATLAYYFINTAIIFILTNIQEFREYSLFFFLYSFLIWVFIFYTDFFPRINNQPTLYEKLDVKLEKVEKSRFIPRFSYIIRTKRGSPLRYFAILFLISIFVRAFTIQIIPIPLLGDILSFLFLVSITFLAHFPAYAYSRKFIYARRTVQNPTPV